MNRFRWMAGLAVLAVAVAGMAMMVQDEPTPGSRGHFQPGPPMPPGTMITHGNYIFVLMGPVLYQVDPTKEMEIVKELKLLREFEHKEPRRDDRRDDKDDPR